MPVWPKSFFNYGASLLTAHTAWRLRRKSGAVRAQHAALAALIRRLAATSFWREAGLEAGATYETFRTRIAPRSHEQLAPAIERMMRGESDVLWPGQCVLFANTAGTTTGHPRQVPVTEEMLAHFRSARRDALLYYTARVGHAGVFRGRHLFLGGSTALTPLPGANSPGTYAGELSGILALSLSRTEEKHLAEPSTAIAEMSDGLAKFDAIAARAANEDIALIAGLPAWTLLFAEGMRAADTRGQAPIKNLQERWPNFECFMHGGGPLAPWQAELRQALGPTVTFNEVFAASEGFVAAQDGEAAAGLRLMADTGIFFEFLPMADFDAARLEQLGPKAVPLDDVKAGVDYALLLTTPGGLARYLPGDVVRFTSTLPPRLMHVGHTTLSLSAFGERVTGKDATEALLAVCQRQAWSIVNFHVAPLPTATLTGQKRGRHEWWIELRRGTAITPIGPQISAALDVELGRLNPDYAARRKSGAIEPPTVRLVMPGVFEHWLRFKGRWGGQNKTPRCRSDRLIADELAQITNFAPD